MKVSEMNRLLLIILLNYCGLKFSVAAELLDIKGEDLIGSDITGWDYKNNYVRITFNEDIDHPLLIAKIICKDCENEPTIDANVENDVLKLEFKKGPSEDVQWQLYVNGKIDYENMKTNYQFQMRVGLSSATFLIFINNIDNKPPIITTENKDCVVKETPIGVGRTKCVYIVKDPDGDDFIGKIRIDFAKLSSSEIPKKFSHIEEILKDESDPMKYIKVTLTVQEVLDFETVPLYSFNLRANDTNYSTEYGVIVNVQDIADTPPTWTKIFASKSFYEEGDEKFAVEAIDGDIQIKSPIEYKIDFTASDKQLKEKISIDSSGTISVNKIDRDTLDESMQDIIEFKLTAAETEPSCDFPPEIKNCPVNDVDVTETVCQECGGKWINMNADATATFIIKDINDNKPRVDQLKDIVIPENRILIYNDQKLNINDIDLGNNAKCDIKLIEKCPNTAYDEEPVEGAFQLIPPTGFQKWESQISVIKTILDYEDPNLRNIKLFVYTKDLDGNTTCEEETRLNIIVENRNDEIPIFYDCNSNQEKADFLFEIEETVPENTEIGRICAKDRDVDDTLIFDFVASSTKESFILEPLDDKGVILKTKKDKTFDFETMPEVVINVKATDTLKTKYNDPLHTEFATVTINVIEINYKPPRITVNDIPSIKENVEKGTIFIGREEENPRIITAKDPNTSAKLSFSIVWNESRATKQGQKVPLEEYEGCFSIETHSNTDNPSDSRNVYARLVVQEVRKNVTIDYEKYEFLDLKIKVNDDDQTIEPTFDTVTISIRIEDVNDNPPIFDKNTLTSKKSVVETNGPTTYKITVGSIIATDADGPGFNNVTYYITPADNYTEYQNVIKINELTGELYMDEGTEVDADTYNYCKQGLFYEVRATDQAFNTTANFHVSVVDTNNKFPQWENKDLDIFKVPENTKRLPLGTIKAFDEDCEELFHTVVFVFKDLSLSEMFHLDRYNGDLSVFCKDQQKEKCLDRDGTDGTNGHDFYDITIQLRDMNGTGDYKTTDITITVPIEDVNDHAPILQPAELLSITEDTENNYPIGKIEAVDIDKPNTPNSLVEFEIFKLYRKISEMEDVMEIDRELMKINNATGVLNTRQKFKTFYGTIIVEIIAKDHGVPQLTNSRNYTFEVGKYNFLPPSFVFPSNSEITLLKDQIPFSQLQTSDGSELNRINATDNQGEKYKIKFEILSQKPQSLFEIHPRQNLHSNTADLWVTKVISDGDPLKYEVVFKASHEGVGADNQVEIKTVIKFVDQDEEPYFKEPQEECRFHEEYTNETCEIIPAYDPKGNADIYYYLYKSDGEIFSVLKNPKDGKGTQLGVKVGLDIEIQPNYTVYIRASSANKNPVVEPKNPDSILTVPVGLIDINNHPPKFEQASWVAGLSEQDDPNKTPIIKLNATDVDEVDENQLKFSMVPNSLKASNKDLEIYKKPFNIEENGFIFNNFKPKSGMKGYFTFDVQVTDSAPQYHTDTSSVQVYIISEAVRVSFVFNNTLNEIENSHQTIEEIFKRVFKYDCTFDSSSQATDDNGNPIPGQVLIKVHFMNDDSPVDKEEIVRKSNDLGNIALLKVEFDKAGLNYMSKDSNNENASDNTEEDLEKMKIVLIVVTVILSLACAILIIAFVLRTKSLTRRLDAMNVPVFGSTNSGLNRIGTTAPGTNKHAIEANPVYHTDIKPDFDTISQGSGDSDLIGIEDNKDFDTYPEKNFVKGNKNKSTLNPLASAPSQDDKDDIFI